MATCFDRLPSNWLALIPTTDADRERDAAEWRANNTEPDRPTSQRGRRAALPAGYLNIGQIAARKGCTTNIVEAAMLDGSLPHEVFSHGKRAAAIEDVDAWEPSGTGRKRGGSR